jgi:plastocyanin
VSRKLNRWLLVGALAAGFAAPMLPAQAGGAGIDVANNQFGNGGQVQSPKDEAVTWHINEDTHTVSPDPEMGGLEWPAKESGPLKAPTDFKVTFNTAGTYYYKCEIQKDMKGSLLIKDSTPPPPPPPAPTTTTAAPTTTTTTTVHTATPAPTTPTTAGPASSAGAKPSGTAAPAPTTTTAKDKKGKDDNKEEETTTTTVAPPPPPVDLPDSAIIPVLPGAATGSTTQNGVEAPTDTPEGDAIALLKSKKSGGQATKLLILSGFGLGALGIGTAGYKYANRSSKYFPA